MDQIGAGSPDDDVVAISGIDEEVAAEEGNAGEIKDIPLPAAEECDACRIGGGIDDLLDATAGGECAAQADVHRPGACGEDLIDAISGGTAVAVGVVAGEGVGLIRHPVWIGAADEEGVAAATAIEGVFAEATVEDVGAAAAAQDVVAPAAIQQVGAAAAIDEVIAPAGEHLLALPIADDCLARFAAQGETAIGEEIVQPTGNIAERLVGIAVLIEEVFAADLEAEVINAVGDSVHQVLAEELGGGAVVLDQVEAGFAAVLIVTVRLHERLIPVLAHPAVDHPQVVAADPAVEIDVGGADRLQQDLVELVGGRQTIVDVQSGGVARQAGIQPNPVHHPIKTAAGGGGIAVVVGDPLGYIADAGVGVAVLVLEAPVGVDREPDMENAIEDGVDGVLAEEVGVAPIVLHEVVTGLAAVFVIAVPLHESCVAIRVALDPAVDPTHFSCAEACAIAIGLVCGLEGGDSVLDQVVEVIGGLGPPLDLRPGDRSLQARIRHDRLDDAVEVAARVGQIHLQGGEPTGHIGEGGVVVAVLVGEASAVGAERKPDVISPVEHRVDQGAAIELAVAAIVLDGVEARLRFVLIVAVQLLEALQALRMGGIAEPAVEVHDFCGGQHRFVEGADVPQALGDQTVQPVRRGDAAAD